MSELIIWTYDWVPKGPRGFVRDLRLRWACEEAGLAYSVRTVPFDGRETNHLSRQPFGQVPFLSDGELEVFESGVALRRDVRPGAFRGGKFSDPASS
jgi:glutathione S-transferase